MARRPAALGELIAVGALGALVALGAASSGRPAQATRPPPRGPARLVTAAASFLLHASGQRVAVRSADGALDAEVDLALVLDGVPYPLVLVVDTRGTAGRVQGTCRLPGPDGPVDVDVSLETDARRDALVLRATLPSAAAGDHRIAWRAELGTELGAIFVAGVGAVAEQATVSGSAVLFEGGGRPLAFGSRAGPVTVAALSEEFSLPGEAMRVDVTGSPSSSITGTAAELHLVASPSSDSVWEKLMGLAGIPSGSVHGRVTGTSARAHVIGRDARGVPQIWSTAGPDGTFSLHAPASVVEWYATMEPPRASRLTHFVPGSDRDLVLDIAPSGDLHVTVVDADTRRPLTARLLFQGLDGSVDPNFGPDYRASGAGPVIDALRGDAHVALPTGRYRVAATKGIEWTVDAQQSDIEAGRAALVELALRHVVATPALIDCDLHVHARPSFDSRVTPEDRVLSLAAAGIDFAVPTEHNIVGDYAPAIAKLDLEAPFLSVPGVEITTYNPRIGHFGAFPFPRTVQVPPYQNATVPAIVRTVRADPSRYFQVNHPRLPGAIGYFDDIGFDPRSPRPPPRNRLPFDGIEVYSGFDIEQPERVEAVLRDYWALLDFGWRFTATGSSDSHRIQYHWAGYPRTMVQLGPPQETALQTPVDPRLVIDNLKAGHATVTSGPIIDFVLSGARPGDELVSNDDVLHGHIRVRAAPWLDVDEVEIVAGQVGGGWDLVDTLHIDSIPTRVGPEPGSLDEAAARCTRLDRDVEIALGPKDGWVQVIARGKRPMSDVLPFVPVAPLGFTNPVYVMRGPAPTSTIAPPAPPARAP